jgi:hypothetical protein
MKSMPLMVLAAAMGQLYKNEAEPDGAAAGTGAPPPPPPEDAAAKAAAQAAADRKAEEKAKKDQEKAEKKAAAEKAKAEKKEAAEKLKAEAKEKKEAEKKAKEDAKAAKKAQAEEAKKTSTMPESNGIRRPKPDTLCGKAWAVMDKMTADQGSPVAISSLLAVTTPMNLNEGNVKAEYARWRKYNSISGRILPPAPPAAPPAPPVAPSE